MGILIIFAYNKIISVIETKNNSFKKLEIFLRRNLELYKIPKLVKRAPIKHPILSEYIRKSFCNLVGIL